ncbi:MAG: hypothetical protein MHPSP_003444, partial [Paramarteilia canceri]
QTVNIGIGGGRTVAKFIDLVIENSNYSIKIFVASKFIKRELVNSTSYQNKIFDLYIEKPKEICLTVDGADQIIELEDQENFLLIKGAGGCFKEEFDLIQTSKKVFIAAELRKYTGINEHAQFFKTYFYIQDGSLVDCCGAVDKVQMTLAPEIRFEIDQASIISQKRTQNGNLILEIVFFKKNGFYTEDIKVLNQIFTGIEGVISTGMIIIEKTRVKLVTESSIL